jgi:hypothetical protein
MELLTRAHLILRFLPKALVVIGRISFLAVELRAFESSKSAKSISF